MENKTLIIVVLLVVIIFLLRSDLTASIFHNNMDMMMNDMDEHRMSFLSQRNGMVSTMMAHGQYRCCLEKPCTYCIEKTPGHGEGAACDCLSDVVNGQHPCGECIGEILEGHGNPYLAEYFAAAIGEEVGMQHINTLREIISEKYNISIEAQL